MEFNKPMPKFSKKPPSPDKIDSTTDLRIALRHLYEDNFRTLADAAAAAGLSIATVHNLVNADHPAVPTAQTINKFVSSCGQDIGPWLAARQRIHRSYGTRGPNLKLSSTARHSLALLLAITDSDRRRLQNEALILYACVREELRNPDTRLAFITKDGTTKPIEVLFS
jgi:hypothetical protein